MLSRTKPAVGPGAAAAAKDTKKKKKMPTVEEFLDMRDYTGAITLLEVINNFTSLLIINLYTSLGASSFLLKHLAAIMEVSCKYNYSILYTCILENIT